MHTLEALKQQLKTTRDLHSVVTTMKALAAGNIRQCEQAVASLAEFARTVEMGFQVVLRAGVSGVTPRPAPRRRLAVDRQPPAGVERLPVDHHLLPAQQGLEAHQRGQGVHRVARLQALGERRVLLEVVAQGQGAGPRQLPRPVPRDHVGVRLVDQVGLRLGAARRWAAQLRTAERPPFGCVTTRIRSP